MASLGYRRDNVCILPASGIRTALTSRSIQTERVAGIYTTEEIGLWECLYLVYVMRGVWDMQYRSLEDTPEYGMLAFARCWSNTVCSLESGLHMRLAVLMLLHLCFDFCCSYFVACGVPLSSCKYPLMFSFSSSVTSIDDS